MPDNKQADTKKVEKDHATSGRPVSPTEDPTDHSVPATQIAKQIDPKRESGATVNARSMAAIDTAAAEGRDAQNEEDRERLEEDTSLAGRMRKSELFLVNDHPSGGGPYIGISPQNDPKASDASKRLSSVQALDLVAPRTGMIVKPKDGDPFTIGDGFGPDAVPGDWARVINPHTKKPLFG